MKTIKIFLLSLLITLVSFGSKACHALPIVNFSVEYVIDAGDTIGIEINGASAAPTCGCSNIYWMDIEVRCVGEPFDGAPFNPGFYGPLDTYPYFQSPQLNKPGCQLTPYPTTFIPFTAMCPGIQYQVRVRENHNGDVGTWETPIPFQVPGVPVDLEGFAEQAEDSICIGDSVNLSFVITEGCFNGLDFEWEVSGDDNGQPDGNWAFVNDQDSIWVAPTAPSWYRVTVDGPCNNDFILDTVFIYVSSVPTLSVLDTFVCEGESVDMLATVDLLGGTFIWEVNPSINDSILLNLSPIETTTYLLEYNYEGCVVSDSGDIIVHGQPEAFFEVDDVCFSEDINFQGNSGTNDQIVEWIWNFDNGDTSFSQNSNYMYPSTGFYNVSFTVETEWGCSDTYTAPVSIFPNPEPDFSMNGIFCSDNIINFNDMTNSNDPLDSWSWNLVSEQSTEQNPSTSYENSGSYNVNLTVETINGCFGQIDSTITINPTPVINFDTTLLLECSPLNFELTAGNISGDSIIDYVWTYSTGVTVNNQTLSGILDNFTSNPIFYGITLTVTSDEGCIGEYSADNVLGVYPNPTAYFTTNFTNNETSLLNTIVNFNNESELNDKSDWVIYDGNNPIYSSSFSGNNQDLIYEFDEKPNEYSVKLITETDFGCQDSITSIIRINDVELIYVPNTFTPDGDGINEEFLPKLKSGFDPLDYKLEIFNKWGELLFVSYNPTIGWDGTYGGRVIKEGTYIWKIRAKTTNNDTVREFVGHINLIR